MPVWLQALLAVLSFFGGGFASEVLALIRSREGALWKEIERLHKQADALARENRRLRGEKD